MRNFMYYGEMVAKISAYVHGRPECGTCQLSAMEAGLPPGGPLWALCADAAQVFKQVEDSCDGLQVDWHQAVEGYAREIDDFLRTGRHPGKLEMFQMTARSIEKCAGRDTGL